MSSAPATGAEGKRDSIDCIFQVDPGRAASTVEACLRKDPEGPRAQESMGAGEPGPHQPLAAPPSATSEKGEPSMQEPKTATTTKTRQATQVLDPDQISTVERSLGIPSRLEAQEETELVRREKESVLSWLQQLDDGAKIYERFIGIAENARKVAIRRTNPEDWVISVGRDGVATGMLCASGSDSVAETYGIEILEIGPMSQGMFNPIKKDHGAGIYSLSGWVRAYSKFNGRRAIYLEATRRSDEDFTGRGIDAGGKITTRPADKTQACETDLRSSVLTLLRVKPVRVLAAMVRVSEKELGAAWMGTSKTTASCRRGHGFGSSQERTAGSVADAGTIGNAEELWKDCLRRTGGNEDEAKNLLKRSTSYPAGTNRTTKRKYNAFGGTDNWRTLTKDSWVRMASDKIQKDELYGDQVPSQESPADVPDEAPEPGSEG